LARSWSASVRPPVIIGGQAEPVLNAGDNLSPSEANWMPISRPQTEPTCAVASSITHILW
jgi:hypothetical protein